MGRWLLDLADVCRRTGLPVVEVDGWQSRARSGTGGHKTDGYETGRPSHLMAHHTASGPSSDGWPDVNYIATGSGDAPIANLYLSRVPEIYVIAAGATNTNGSGHDPCGYTPDDSMNSHAIGIEAGNQGTGEVWPEAMLDAYERLCHVLGEVYGIPTGRVHGHMEWAPSRKVDPAGPPRYATGAQPWDMALFRAAVDGAPPPEPGPGPEPTPPPEDWMAKLPTIKKGDKGDYVERMQHLLAAAGYMNAANVANYDGVWGNGTDDAKRRFDNDHGLTPSPPTDCGDKSWESLMTGKRW